MLVSNQPKDDPLFEEIRRLNLELEQHVAERTRQLREANRELEERRRQLEEANNLLQHRNRELEALALTDPLTGLLNRRAVEDVARTELNRLARYPDSQLAIGIIDADNFRDINHQHLHPGGDQALIEIARVLTATIRSVDTVGRIGGDELLFIAPKTGFEGAQALAERIRRAVQDSSVFFNHVHIPLTVSIGVAVADKNVATTLEEMIHLASACLHDAKAAGKNRSVIRSVGG
jgi:diguanylate cyclase